MPTTARLLSSFYLLFFLLLTAPGSAQQPMANRRPPNRLHSTLPFPGSSALDSIFLSQSFANKEGTGSVLLRARHPFPMDFQGINSAMPAQYSPSSFVQRTTAAASRVGCLDSSGRKLYLGDSLPVYLGYTSRTRDGNFLIAGTRMFSYVPHRQTGVLIKCKPSGDTLWVKNIGGDMSPNTVSYTNAYEMYDGSILLTGQINVPVSVNSRHDLILTKLSAAGDFQWQRTFVPNYQYAGGGSSPLINITDLQSTQSGDLFICGGLITGGFSRFGFAAKMNKDGVVIWSRGLALGGFMEFVGFNLVGNELHAYGSAYSDWPGHLMMMTSFDTGTGDTVFSKKWMIPHGPGSDRLFFRPMGITRLTNGNTTIYGRCASSGNPLGGDAVGRVATLEISPSFTAIGGYRVMNNRNEPVFDYTRIKVYEDGSAAFAGLYEKGQLHVGKIVNRQVIKERTISYQNKSFGWLSNFEQTAGGDFLAVNTGETFVHSGIEVLNLHASDTSGGCLGTDIEKSFLIGQPYVSVAVAFDSTLRNVMMETFNHRNYVSFNEGLTLTSQCKAVSFCDSLKLNPFKTSICLPSPLTLRFYKNKECGSGVAWDYDKGSVNSISHLNDSTVEFRFRNDFRGYIKAKLPGCVAIEDSIFVTVTQTQGSVQLGPDKTLCPGNTILLNARKGYATYKWQDGSADSTFAVTQPGLYHVTTTDACGGTYRDTITITAAPPIPFSAGPDRTKCNSDTIRLSAPDGFLSYAWSNNYNLSSVVAQTVTVNPLVDTAYYVKAEKTPGCFAYDTVRVKVFHAPPIDLGADRRFCLGDSAVFAAGTGFATYLWSNGQSGHAIVVKTAGTYSVTASTAEGCKSRDTVQVLQVYALPQPRLDKNGALCLGDSRSLKPGDFAAYQWSNNSSGPSLTVNAIGIYAVTVTDQNGCKGSDTTRITTIHPLPQGFLPADTAICSYSSLELKPSVEYNRYTWSNGTVVKGITITQPGQYSLDVIDSRGCRGKDTVVVSVKDCMSGLYVPTAFSPNRDGKNDLFRPLLFGNVKQFRFTVYNRWGQIIYQTTELQKGWDGRLAGKDAETGVFVWTCAYQLADGEPKTEKGTVTLIR
jgi:gliding motility-associated-like protein